MVVILLFFAVLFHSQDVDCQRTVAGYRPRATQQPIQTSQVKPVPSIPSLPPNIVEIPSQTAPVSGNGTLHVLGRIPTQLGSSVGAISNRVGLELDRGVNRIGQGVGQIPRALASAVGSVGDAVGGGVGGVADTGLDETIKVAGSVGDTVRGIPIAAGQVLSGLTRGTQQQGSATGRGKRHVQKYEPDFCEIVARKRTLLENVLKLPNAAELYGPLISSLTSFVNNGAQLCGGGIVPVILPSPATSLPTDIHSQSTTSENEAHFTSIQL